MDFPFIQFHPRHLPFIRATCWHLKATSLFFSRSQRYLACCPEQPHASTATLKQPRRNLPSAALDWLEISISPTFFDQKLCKTSSKHAQHTGRGFPSPWVVLEIERKNFVFFRNFSEYHPLLVFLHGFQEAGNYFFNLVIFLAKNFFVRNDLGTTSVWFPTFQLLSS